MNSKKRLLFSIVIICSLFFSSCKKDDSSQMSQEEIQNSFVLVSDSYYNKTNSYSYTQGSDVEYQLEDITSLPFMYMPELFSSSSSQNASLTSKIFKGGGSFSNNFDFNYYKGTWNFQGLYSQWGYSSTPNDKILAKFPFPYNFEGTNTNNATLTLSNYTSTTVNQNKLMTGLKASIVVSSNEIWANEYIASYPIQGQEVIKTIKKVGTYTKTNEDEVIDNSNNTIIKNQFQFQAANDLIYQTNSITTINKTLSPKTATVEAKILIQNIEFRITLLFNYNDYQNAAIDLNNVIKIEVYNAENTKLADLIFKKTGGYWDLWIKFTDGKEVISENYLQEFDSFINRFSRNLFSF